jgi:hypothetical protein
MAHEQSSYQLRWQIRWRADGIAIMEFTTAIKAHSGLRKPAVRSSNHVAVGKYLQ